MYFSSFEALINMGGHGTYVWLSYGAGLIVFTIAFVNPLMRRKRIIKELSQLQRRQLSKRSENNSAKVENESIN